MDNRSSVLIEDLKLEYHSVAYGKFIKVFKKIIDENHDKLDTATMTSVPHLQGQNIFLKKLIKDLTTDRESKYDGM